MASDPTSPADGHAVPSGDSPKRHGDPLANTVATTPGAAAAGNPAAFDQAAQGAGGNAAGGASAGDPAATSKVLHPPGSTVPAAAHAAPGTKLEGAIEAGLTDADPADRPHGNPNRPAPAPDEPGTRFSPS